MARLIDVGGRLLDDLDPDTVLERILDAGRAITGARYAALGVLDPERRELTRFLTSGISPELRQEIGELPRGRGVLGVVIEDRRPLTLTDVASHPRSFGFPAGHPPMRTFLGVPIIIRGESWGNLYLTEKADGAPFSPADEDAVVVLAGFAATAIETARLYDTAERSRLQLARAVEGLEAARTVTDAIGAGTDLPAVLTLVVERAQTLVSARSVLILLRDGAELEVAASAGVTSGAAGRRIPIGASTAGGVLLRGVPVRVTDVRHQLQLPPERLGVPGAENALFVPMAHRGEGLGVLVAFDRRPDQAPFTAADEELLRAFASSAANAVAISRTVAADRLATAISAAEDERRRWARELHDQTLQSLGGVRVLLDRARQHPNLTDLPEVVSRAVDDLDSEIANLRGIIADLRPSILDDLGLRAALEALIERRREDGLQIRADLRVPGPDRAGELLSPQLEMTLYRFVQEALTNVVKHAHADRAWVSVTLAGEVASVDVRDDGVGFDPAAPLSGFGLSGLRERVYLAGGEVSVSSDAGGTRVRATIPAGVGTPLGPPGPAARSRR